MKSLKYLVGTAAALAMFAVAGGASAQITNSPHDLRPSSTNTVKASAGSSEEICVYCHTPHAGSTAAQPLWNRDTPSATFTMYDSTFSDTIDMAVDGTPGGVSMACLSCHEGSLAPGALANGPGSGDTDTSTWVWQGGGVGGTNALANVGADLTNDHPISITFSTAADADFKNPSGTIAKLSNGKVECSSCHDPHDDTTNAMFLRASNANSAICLDCHIK